MSEEQEVVERRTAVLTRKVKEINQGKDEMFLALIEATQAQIALEEIRLAIDTGIDENNYEEIANQAIDAILEYRVNREQKHHQEVFESFYEKPLTFSTYDAERLRYLVDDDD